MALYLWRVVILLTLIASAALLASACGDDDDDDSAPTPFIAPEALSTVEALSLLDEIETLVNEPNAALIAVAQVSDADVQERSSRILRGQSDASGLDDVRIALESGDRVGAGEYLFNVVREDAQIVFSESDTNEIDEETLDQLDLNGSFDADHENGMPVSGVYKPAVLKMMELWYGLLGVPPEDVESTP